MSPAAVPAPCPSCAGRGTSDKWALHQEPHRHYKLNDSWSIGGVRIAGVTSVLDAGQDALTAWATSTTLAAAENAVCDWFDADVPLATSVLSFGELVALGGRMPNDIRDAAAVTGTRLHHYIAERLSSACEAFEGAAANEDYDCMDDDSAPLALPYGLVAAVEAYLDEHQPYPCHDHAGPRVERCVGSRPFAYAGTYDAQVWMGVNAGRHRLDLKSSNTVQPKHLAQLAGYEEAARECGEEPSDFLTVLHVNRCGDYKLHTIPATGQPYALAVGVFHAHLVNHRGVPALAKLLRA